MQAWIPTASGAAGGGVGGGWGESTSVRLVMLAFSSSCSMRRLALEKLSSSTTVAICSRTQETSITKLMMKKERPLWGVPLASIRSRESSHALAPGDGQVGPAGACAFVWRGQIQLDSGDSAKLAGLLERTSSYGGEGGLEGAGVKEVEWDGRWRGVCWQGT